jgi:hypothetical protein
VSIYSKDITFLWTVSSVGLIRGGLEQEERSSKREVIFLSFSYFLKIKRRLMRSPCCLSVYLSVPVNLSIYSFHFFEACEIALLSVHPPNFFVFYEVHVVSKESRLSILPRTF